MAQNVLGNDDWTILYVMFLYINGNSHIKRVAKVLRKYDVRTDKNKFVSHFIKTLKLFMSFDLIFWDVILG